MKQEDLEKIESLLEEKSRLKKEIEEMQSDIEHNIKRALEIASERDAALKECERLRKIIIMNNPLKRAMEYAIDNCYPFQKTEEQIDEIFESFKLENNL